MAIVHSTAALIQHQWLMSLGEDTRGGVRGHPAMRDSNHNLQTLISFQCLCLCVFVWDKERVKKKERGEREREERVRDTHGERERGREWAREREMWLDGREILFFLVKNWIMMMMTTETQWRNAACVCVCVVRLGATVSVGMFTLSILLCRSHVSNRWWPRSLVWLDVSTLVSTTC